MVTKIMNATVFEECGQLTKRDIFISGGVISDPLPRYDEIIDADGLMLLPGFIDIHIHGCAGRDFTDGKDGALPVMGKALAQRGITSFCPASMSLSEQTLTEAFTRFREYRDCRPAGCARSAGINMEGPFLSIRKKGAHDEQYIIKPDFEMFDRLSSVSGDSIAITCVAPEQEGAPEFIEKASKQSTVSIAHTMATYEEAKIGFEHGATHVTHLYNAMCPLTHREPGVIGASFDFAKHVELIADGFHISPPVIRMTFQAFGPDRIVLISDAMSALFMEDGNYLLGGLSVIVKGSQATLEDGTIAGSAVSVADCVRRAVSVGIPLETALKAATLNPAKAIRQEENIGSIRTGKYADLQLWDSHLNLKKVMLDGQWI